MPICPGGSQPKSTTPAWLVLVTTAIEVLITRRVPWLAPFLSIAAPFSADMTVFCDSEPPDMPEWSAADLAGILTGQSTEKLAQTIHHVAWYEFCECTAASTPAMPTYLPPSNLPYIAPSTGTACDMVQLENPPWPGLNQSLFPGFRQLPVGATHLRVTHQDIFVPPDDAPDQAQAAITNVTLGVPQYDSAGVLVPGTAGNLNITYPVGGGTPTQSSTFANGALFPINAASVKLQANLNIAQRGSRWAEYVGLWRIEVFCGQPPDRLLPECCPPDPTLVARLEQLRGDLLAVAELVTVIQRQGVPFATVAGLETSGLSGQGEVSLGEPLVAVTLLLSVPSSYGLEEASPDRLFDIGWLAPGTADGFEAHQRITCSPFMLRLSGDHTRLGYSLSPGVTATLRRHVREP